MTIELLRWANGPKIVYRQFACFFLGENSDLIVKIKSFEEPFTEANRLITCNSWIV